MILLYNLKLANTNRRNCRDIDDPRLLNLLQNEYKEHRTRQLWGWREADLNHLC